MCANHCSFGRSDIEKLSLSYVAKRLGVHRFSISRIWTRYQKTNKFFGGKDKVEDKERQLEKIVSLSCTKMLAHISPELPLISSKKTTSRYYHIHQWAWIWIPSNMWYDKKKATRFGETSNQSSAQNSTMKFLKPQLDSVSICVNVYKKSFKPRWAYAFFKYAHSLSPAPPHTHTHTDTMRKIRLAIPVVRIE